MNDPSRFNPRMMFDEPMYDLDAPTRPSSVSSSEPMWSSKTSTTTTPLASEASEEKTLPMLDASRAYDKAYMKKYQKALRKYQKQERRRIYDKTYRAARVLSPGDLARHVNDLHYALNAFKRSRKPDKRILAAVRLLLLVGSPIVVGERTTDTLNRAEEVYNAYTRKPKRDLVKEKIYRR